MPVLTTVEGLLWCGTMPGALEDMKLKESYSWLCKAFLKIRVRGPIEGFSFIFFLKRGSAVLLGSTRLNLLISVQRWSRGRSG